jgi:erythromycin esterase
MIGDARVVLLSEGEHFIAEPLLFRNRLFEYLVERKEFTAVALESGIVESREVHDYVRDGTGSIEGVVERGIGWTFNKLPQNRDFVQWLRGLNEKRPPGHRINFYGFDVPGSPSNPKANRGATTALLETLAFLQRVDEAAFERYSSRLQPFMPDIRFEPYNTAASRGYHRLREQERDAITAAINDLVALFERSEVAFRARTTNREYSWALRAAIGARQVDNWFRQMPLNWSSTDNLTFLNISSDLRDRAQADNLEWILEQEGPRGKILVFAHNNHLSGTAIRWSWKPQVSGRLAADENAITYVRDVAGAYLKRRLGDEVVVICNAVGNGSAGSNSFEIKLDPAAPASVDYIANQVGIPWFLLDLRKVPEPLAGWLNQEREMGRMHDIYRRYRVRSDVLVRDAYDLLLFMDEVTPACPRD